MADQPSETLSRIIELTATLPSEPSAYSTLPIQKRRSLRSQLETALTTLGGVALSLDHIRQPKLVFDPTSPKVIGEIVARTLLLQDIQPLSSVITQTFYGAGVYAIYYSGKFAAYSPIAGKDHPIYVGKADPEALHASTPAEQGTRLHTRLKDHHRSLTAAANLDIDDFSCRFLVVRSAWVETAEDLLIDWFKPVWNRELEVCYGFGKHGDSAATRANERSPWDTIHPGRAWATSDQNTPNKRSASQILTDVATHFAKFPPRS